LSGFCDNAAVSGKSSGLPRRPARFAADRRAERPRPAAERRRDGMKYFDIDDLNNKDSKPITKVLDEILAGKK
jgi:hypothetical protein